MTLLGWMHRKLRQSSIEPLKKVTIGNPCTCLSAHPQFDEQHYYPEPNYHAALLRQTAASQKSSIGLKGNTVEELFEEESFTMVHKVFHGFLAIGTLGTEAFTIEPTTQELETSFGNTDKETNVTERELKLINDQLEKFLEAEAEAEDIGKASPERSSHASIITLSSGKIAGMDAKEHGNMVPCPLQEYHFGSPVELPDTQEEEKREKTTLWELLENHSITYKKDMGKTEDIVEGDGIHFMKKILKKLCLSSKKCTASVGKKGTSSGSTMRKVPKFLSSFHRKIHPETAEKHARKWQNYETVNTSHNGGHHYEEVRLTNNENTVLLHTTMPTKETASVRMSPRLKNSHSRVNGEHWIKTDVDYLVLEFRDRTSQSMSISIQPFK